MLPAFSFQDVIWTVSRRCAIQEKEHRDALCAFIPPRVPRPILHNHVAPLQLQELAAVKLEPNLSLADNLVGDDVSLVRLRNFLFAVIGKSSAANQPVAP